MAWINGKGQQHKKKSHRAGVRDGAWLAACVLSISGRTMEQDISAASLGCVLLLPENRRPFARSAKPASLACSMVVCGIDLKKSMKNALLKN